MIIHQIKELPPNHEEYESEAWGDYEIDKIPPEVDEAWYWYGRGDYCGTGQLLMRANGLWYLKSCGHCSCYGPTDEGICDDGFTLSQYKSYETLEELLSFCSAHYQEEVRPLMEAASKDINNPFNA